MIKYIVAPALGTRDDEAVIGTALAVAAAFSAHVDFLHVRLDVALIAVADGGMGAALSQTTIDGLDAGEDDAQARALGAVTRLCEAQKIAFAPAAPVNGASAAFTVETGDRAEWIAGYGRFADLMVLGRIGSESAATIDVLETALLESGRPLLIPASPGAIHPITGIVAVAWTDSKASLRAVHAAMPFLARASGVIVLCVDADAAQTATADRLLDALRWHNANTTVHHAPGGPAGLVETLLAAAEQLGASLLVMGGYSHSPLREMVFGGATKSVLENARLPVLMAH
jgi:nucleotide-binding universal stress UspA family protein